METMANKLLTLLDQDNRETWKYPEMYDICKLAVEYLSLSDGLESARRGSDIVFEIAEIAETL